MKNTIKVFEHSEEGEEHLKILTKASSRAV